MKVREEPWLTLNGVVRLMAAQEAHQREAVLRDFKFPDPEGDARARYYQPSLDAIRAFHGQGNDRGAFDSAVAALERHRSTTSSNGLVKIDNNVRVMRAYPGRFGDRRLDLQESEPLTVDVEGVGIRLQPDLVAREGARLRLIRFCFQKDGPTDSERRFSVQLLRLYGAAAGLEIGPADCQMVAVADGSVEQLSGSVSKFEARLKASMREARRVWAGLDA